MEWGEMSPSSQTIPWMYSLRVTSKAGFLIESPPGAPGQISSVGLSSMASYSPWMVWGSNFSSSEAT